MALQPFIKADFLQLWRGVLPESYTYPLEQSEAGLDIPSAHAAIWARVEQAANRSQGSYYLRAHSTQTAPIASGPVKATGTVELRRAAPALGDIAFPRGTVLIAEVRDSLGGTLFLGRFLTTADAQIDDASIGPVTVVVEAEFPGYTGEVAAGSIVRFEPQGRRTTPATVDTTTRVARSVPSSDGTSDPFDATLIGRYVRLVSSLLVSVDARAPRLVTGTYIAVDGQVGLELAPALDAADLGKAVTVEVEEYEDLGVTVTQPAETTGGAPDALGAIGSDRGIGRVPGETDANFRARFEHMADILTPAAHIRILDRILGSAGIDYEYLETGDVEGLMGFTWDVHPYDVGQVCPPIEKLPGSELVGQGIVWLGPGTLTRFFVICVGTSLDGEFGFFYDADWFAPGFPNAWDLGVYDGAPLGYQALIGQVWNEINDARAAGVGFIIIQDEA